MESELDLPLLKSFLQNFLNQDSAHLLPLLGSESFDNINVKVDNANTSETGEGIYEINISDASYHYMLVKADSVDHAEEIFNNTDSEFWRDSQDNYTTCVSIKKVNTNDSNQIKGSDYVYVEELEDEIQFNQL